MKTNMLVMVLAVGLAGAGCGEDSAPPSGGSVGNEGEGAEGEGSPNEGEGEEPVAGEGEGGVVPPGADGTPCTGLGNECQEGLGCEKCDETGLDTYASGEPCDGKVCTCENHFGGPWRAEFTNVRAVDYEYDFTVGNVDAEFWSSREIQLTERGCAIEGPRVNTALGGGDSRSGGRPTENGGFWYKTWVGTRDGDAWITFTGQLDALNEYVLGTCEGTYPDVSVLPHVLFRVECDFKLTRG